jgi:hypothetical protein
MVTWNGGSDPFHWLIGGDCRGAGGYKIVPMQPGFRDSTGAVFSLPEKSPTSETQIATGHNWGNYLFVTGQAVRKFNFMY